MIARGNGSIAYGLSLVALTVAVPAGYGLTDFPPNSIIFPSQADAISPSDSYALLRIAADGACIVSRTVITCDAFPPGPFQQDSDTVRSDVSTGSIWHEVHYNQDPPAGSLELSPSPLEVGIDHLFPFWTYYGSQTPQDDNFQGAGYVRLAPTATFDGDASSMFASVTLGDDTATPPTNPLVSASADIGYFHNEEGFRKSGSTRAYVQHKPLADLTIPFYVKSAQTGLRCIIKISNPAPTVTSGGAATSQQWSVKYAWRLDVSDNDLADQMDPVLQNASLTVTHESPSMPYDRVILDIFSMPEDSQPYRLWLILNVLLDRFDVKADVLGIGHAYVSGGCADVAVFDATSHIAVSLSPRIEAEVIINPCRLDWNGDETVDVNDLLHFLGDFREGTADYDGSGATDASDLNGFLAIFRTGSC